MIGYQGTSFHDALYLRELLGLRPAPESELWLRAMGVFDEAKRLLPPNRRGRVSPSASDLAHRTHPA